MTPAAKAFSHMNIISKFIEIEWFQGNKLNNAKYNVHEKLMIKKITSKQGDLENTLFWSVF